MGSARTAPPQHSSASAPSPRRKRRFLRWLLWALLALIVVALAAGAWLAYTGLQAKRALDTAAGALGGAQGALLNGDTEAAAAAVAQASALTAEARSATSDPVWTVAGAVPWVGATPKSVTLSTQAADQVVSEGLPQFVAAAQTLDIPTLKSPEGRVDLARFPPAGAQLAAAEASLRSAEETMAQIPTSGVPGFVVEGTSMLSAQIDEALSISTVAGPLLQVAPQLLGAESPQTYFLAFQSPVEARGTGGFLGTYGLLTVADGDIVNRDVSTNSDLKTFPAPVLDLGPDYAELYGDDVRNWVNMNLSPNYPYAGAQWAQATADQFGIPVAGVLAVDITAMKYLIQATGPITAPDGKVLTADNVVQYLGNDIYFEFEDDNSARKEYQADIATDLLERAIALEGGTSAIIDALTASVSGRHLQMWAAEPTAQQAIAATPLAGATPTQNGPFAQLVVNNGGGNKLDFYLQRKLEYTSGQCFADGRNSTLRATLTNGAPAVGSLPTSITGLSTSTATRSLVYLHLPIDAQVTSITIDGQPASATFGRELGHLVALLPLDLPASVAVTIELGLVEPLSDAAPVVPVQPMVLPQETLVNWQAC